MSTTETGKDYNERPPDLDNKQLKPAMQEYELWLLARTLGSHGQQSVPALWGFTTCSGQAEKRKQQ